MFCVGCGNSLNPGVAFCSKCGLAVGGSVVPTVNALALPQDGQVAVPSYGYTVETAAGRITITVRRRKPPTHAGAQTLAGCGVVMAWVFGIPLCVVIGIVIGALTSDIVSELKGSGWEIGGVIGGLIGFVLLLLITLFDVRKRRRFLSAFDEVRIVVDARNIAVNGTTYARAHVSSWTMRWTNAPGHSVVAVGATPFVAGAMIGTPSEMQPPRRKLKKATASLSITAISRSLLSEG